MCLSVWAIRATMPLGPALTVSHLHSGCRATANFIAHENPSGFAGCRCACHWNVSHFKRLVSNEYASLEIYWFFQKLLLLNYRLRFRFDVLHDLLLGAGAFAVAAVAAFASTSSRPHASVRVNWIAKDIFISSMYTQYMQWLFALDGQSCGIFDSMTFGASASPSRTKLHFNSHYMWRKTVCHYVHNLFQCNACACWRTFAADDERRADKTKSCHFRTI